MNRKNYKEAQTQKDIDILETEDKRQKLIKIITSENYTTIDHLLVTEDQLRMLDYILQTYETNIDYEIVEGEQYQTV